MNTIAGRAIKSGSWRQFLGPFCRVFCSFERQNASNHQMFVCFILSIYLFIPSCPYEPNMDKNNGLALFWVLVLVWFGTCFNDLSVANIIYNSPITIFFISIWHTEWFTMVYNPCNPWQLCRTWIIYYLAETAFAYSYSF